MSASRAIQRRAAGAVRSFGRRQQQVRGYADAPADVAKDAAGKAKDAASKATSKASEGLTRVASSAGPALGRAASGVGSALSRIGGRTGRLIAFGQSLIPPTIYYSKVAAELSKIIFQGQKMHFPGVTPFQNYFNNLVRQARNPSQLTTRATNAVESGVQQAASSPASVLERVRNVDRASLARGGVLFAEALGFFTVGEMIGRVKIVGYYGDAHAQH